MNFKEACNAAADLFEAAPEVWTTGAYARDSADFQVPIDSSSACKFCAVGAVAAAMDMNSVATAWDELYPFARSLYHLDMAMVNDHLGRKTAIRVLREAGK